MRAVNLDIRLSDHFTLREAVRSQVAARNGIDNRPPVEILPKLEIVAHTVLEPVRAAFGLACSPSSWWRGQALERALKRKPPDWVSASQHARGEAVDIELPGVANRELADWIADNLSFDQLILECHDPADPASGWVHVSYVARDLNRGEILTFDGRDYTPGLPPPAAA